MPDGRENVTNVNYHYANHHPFLRLNSRAFNNQKLLPWSLAKTNQNTTRRQFESLSPAEENHIHKLIDSEVHKYRTALTTKDYDDLINLKKLKSEHFRQTKALSTAIGFTVSLLLIIAVFEWQFVDEKDKIDPVQYE